MIQFGLLSIIVSFTAAIGLFPGCIKWLRDAKVGQYIQSDGPKHEAKSQTPTCAGIVVVFVINLTLILTGALKATEIILLDAVLIAYMLVGLYDDLCKLMYKDNNLGLTPRTKFLLQTLLGCLAIISMQYIMGPKFTELSLPLGRQNWWTVDLGWLYYPFGLLAIIGGSNAFNLTDGLDGLFAGLTVIICTGMLIILSLGLTPMISTELIYMVGLLGAICGSLLGFLWYNAYPATVFLGDSGSLSIGACLVCLAILTKTELVFGLMAGVYIMETLSVILQVGYFKLTKGQRIFKMAPLHHHYELCGIKETKIVTRFWILGLIFSVISICLVV